MNEPQIKRIRMAAPYGINPETHQIFGLYQVSVRWPDGRRELFDSEEHARSFIEKRAFNQNALNDEIPDGAHLVFQEKATPKIEQKPKQEVKDYFDVMLLSYDNKIEAIKTVRAITGLGLKESKELIESAPVAVRSGVSKDEAEMAKNQLEAVGVKVELR